MDEGMFVLIDWDNLEDKDRRQGPRYVVDRIWTALNNISPAISRGVQQLHARLYGGWYGWNGTHNVTPMAAQLMTDIQSDFPFILRDTVRNKTIRLSGELAHSLLKLPKQVLPHTLRHRQGPPRLSCADPTKFPCAIQSCPMIGVHQFFSLKKCPAGACTRTIDQLLTRAEQKLVDTMLVSDLIHLASYDESHVAVVSSDDDLWPGMLMAMSNGVHVCHVCTKYSSAHKLYMGSLRNLYSHGGL